MDGVLSLEEQIKQVNEQVEQIDIAIEQNINTTRNAIHELSKEELLERINICIEKCNELMPSIADPQITRLTQDDNFNEDTFIKRRRDLAIVRISSAQLKAKEKSVNELNNRWSNKQSEQNEAEESSLPPPDWNVIVDSNFQDYTDLVYEKLRLDAQLKICTELLNKKEKLKNNVLEQNNSVTTSYQENSKIMLDKWFSIEDRPASQEQYGSAANKSYDASGSNEPLEQEIIILPSQFLEMVEVCNSSSSWYSLFNPWSTKKSEMKNEIRKLQSKDTLSLEDIEPCLKIIIKHQYSGVGHNPHSETHSLKLFKTALGSSTLSEEVKKAIHDKIDELVGTPRISKKMN